MHSFGREVSNLLEGILGILPIIIRGGSRGNQKKTLKTLCRGMADISCKPLKPDTHNCLTQLYHVSSVQMHLNPLI